MTNLSHTQDFDVTQDRELRVIIRRLAEVDSEAYAATLAKILATVRSLRDLRFGTLKDHEAMELVENRVGDLNRDISKLLGDSISRDVRRRDVAELVSEAFAPLDRALSRLDPDEPLAAAVSLAARELSLALAGRRKMGHAWPRWAVALPQDPDGLEHLRCRMTAEDLSRASRVSVTTAKTIEDIRVLDGLLVSAGCADALALLTGFALGRDIPVAIYGRGDCAPLPGIPRFNTAEVAFLHLRDNLQPAAPPFDDDAIADLQGSGPELPGELPGALPLRARLLETENRNLRQGILRHLDRNASMMEEMIKLARESGIEKPFFEIYANGYRMGHSPTHAQLLNSARHRIENLEEKLARLEPAPDEPRSGP